MGKHEDFANSVVSSVIYFDPTPEMLNKLASKEEVLRLKDDVHQFYVAVIMANLAMYTTQKDMNKFMEHALHFAERGEYTHVYDPNRNPYLLYLKKKGWGAIDPETVMRVVPKRNEYLEAALKEKYGDSLNAKEMISKTEAMLLRTTKEYGIYKNNLDVPNANTAAQASGGCVLMVSLVFLLVLFLILI